MGIRVCGEERGVGGIQMSNAFLMLPFLVNYELFQCSISMI